jgi:uncharacterized alkaline shock family protein YloU
VTAAVTVGSGEKIGRIVRAAARSAYGVTAVAGEGWLERLAVRLGLEGGGVRVHIGEQLTVRVNIHLAPGIPAAQTAANVAEAIRYHVRRETSRSVDELSVTVDGVSLAGSEPVAGGGAAGGGGDTGAGR